VLLHTPDVLSEQPSSSVGLKGVFAAIADEVNKFAGLSDHTAVDDKQNNRGDKDYKIYIRGKMRSNEKTVQENSEPSASTFGTSLFSEVCADFPSGNVLLSPLSVNNALVLVKDGATIGSENESELERVLGPPSLIEDDGDSDVQLIMASSIWANSLKQSYIDGAISNHSADAFPMPSRYTPVDKWIEDKTNGMIKGFLGDDKIDSHIVALLVNAVYFKGTWTYAFDPEKTVDGEFVLRDESKLPARFMTATREMEYIGDSPLLGHAQVVMLDYGEESPEPSEFTSMFILPDTSDAASMESVISGLNSRPISVEDTYKTKVDLKLPRFRLEFGPADLKPSLEDMGMNIAFNEKVDGKFDEMSNDSTLTVGAVLHSAVMEVTEKGTEAAAATVVPMRNRSRPRPPPELTFDRPFVVAVIHRATGTPVFMGRVEEPELVF